MEEVATAFNLIRGLVSGQSKTSFELSIKRYYQTCTYFELTVLIYFIG